MKYLPVGLDLRGRACIVVGGGPVGTRKATTLLRAGAVVTVVAPEATQEVARLAGVGRLRWLKREYRSSDLDGSFLAVAATDEEGLNAGLVQDARERGMLVCDSSSAFRSDLIFGALHGSGDVTVAVFTDGRDPSLARRTRDRIAALGEEWEEK
jgi:precorrin-2 dehydrogenase/sirohydrochlorin ferrochelatase